MICRSCGSLDPKIENLYIKAVYKEGEKTKTHGVSNGTIEGKREVSLLHVTHPLPPSSFRPIPPTVCFTRIHCIFCGL